MSWLNTVKQLAGNLPGWRTKRKIVIIQSDDWGSIRMPSLQIRKELNKHELINANDAYSFNDNLETPKDLSALFEVLSSVKDKNGKPAVLTANCLMANPNFEKIFESGYKTYHYEKLEYSFEKMNRLKSLDLWKEGKQKGLFIPQFHGREHINVSFWMKQLRLGHPGVRAAFKLGVCSVNFHDLPYRKDNFQAAWDYITDEDKKTVYTAITDGANLFKKRFGEMSRTAVAPSYVWDASQEKLLNSLGIKIMQGTPYQFIPNDKMNKFSKKFRYTRSGQEAFQMRNVFFEPTLQPTIDVVDHCMSRIKNAFSMRKPAIIGSHRVNFMGALNEINRDRNLRLLKSLLNSIVSRWPQVEFYSSDKLFVEK